MSGLDSSAADWAGRYIARGWFPVPVPARAKAPALAAWQELRLGVADIPKYFINGGNLGVNLGASNLADIDLDCPEALALADDFLPATGLVFGRPGKLRSHRLYSGAAFKYEKFNDPVRVASKDEVERKRATLIELRADSGHQTIFPPSRHPEGEIIAWVEEGQPTAIGQDDLRAAAAALSAAALIVRYWPPGARHDAALALAGGLLRVGWTKEKAAHFISAVARAAGDPEVADRARAVEDTAKALQAGQAVTGWPKLGEILGDQVSAKVRAWLGISYAEKPRDDGESDRPARGPSQATRLVALAEAAGVCLFHTPEGQAYGVLTVNGHKETHSLHTGAFRDWLARRFYCETHTTPGTQALQDAIHALEGQARYEGEQQQVFVRLARHGEAIYLDLANEQWQAVQVTAAGWQVINDPPVKFRRPKGLGTLPLPERGWSVDHLWPFVNVGDIDNFALLVAFVVGALRPEGPYPILVLGGEQGAAKSTLARLVVSLIDPHRAPLRTQPQNERDLAIAADHSWLLVYDNLSHISGWLSDALCRLSTGGGFATRELYSDSEETIFDAQRPIILTSIESITTRSDLLDRAILLTLDPIADHARRPERELWAAYEVERPRILGALLDAVACALRRLPETQLDKLPRMADFALWAVAAEPGLGLQPGKFLAAYTGNRKDAVSLALEADGISGPLNQLMNDHQEWKGSASELLDDLAALVSDAVKKSEWWPKRADKLSNRLRRLAPDLRRIGIDVQFSKGHSRGRLIIITKVEQSSVPGVPGVHSTPGNGQNRDATPGGGDATAPAWDATGWQEDASRGTGDARDTRSPSYSKVEARAAVCAECGSTRLPSGLCPFCDGNQIEQEYAEEVGWTRAGIV